MSIIVRVLDQLVWQRRPNSYRRLRNVIRFKVCNILFVFSTLVIEWNCIKKYLHLLDVLRVRHEFIAMLYPPSAPTISLLTSRFIKPFSRNRPMPGPHVCYKFQTVNPSPDSTNHPFRSYSMSLTERNTLERFATGLSTFMLSCFLERLINTLARKLPLTDMKASTVRGRTRKTTNAKTIKSDFAVAKVVFFVGSHKPFATIVSITR